MDKIILSTFVRSLGEYLRQRENEVRRVLEQADSNDDPALGRKMAVRETLSLMQNQADAFRLARRPVGLDVAGAECEDLETVVEEGGSTVPNEDCSEEFISDLVYLLRERTVEARNEYLHRTDGTNHERAREDEFRGILAWMQEKADALAIPRAEICLSGFDAKVDPVDP